MSVPRRPEIISILRPEVVISTLGTTIAKAGPRPSFAAIDHDAVGAVAEAAKIAGERQFVMVSSVAASSRSANVYIATKGRAEAIVTTLGFERLDIFRPGCSSDGGRTIRARPNELETSSAL